MVLHSRTTIWRDSRHNSQASTFKQGSFERLRDATEVESSCPHEAWDAPPPTTDLGEVVDWQQGGLLSKGSRVSVKLGTSGDILEGTIVHVGTSQSTWTYRCTSFSRAS